MEIAPLVVVTSPIIYAGTGLRVKRGSSYHSLELKTMDTIWAIIILVSTPIAGVVGFAIQLRSIKNVRLENEKLQLEIELLKKQQKQSESQIVVATNDEVKEYSSDVRYSLSSGNNIDLEVNNGRNGRFSLKEIDWAAVLIGAGLIYLLLRFFFDLYSVVLWTYEKF